MVGGKGNAGGKGTGSFRQKLPTAGGGGQRARQTGWSKNIDAGGGKKRRLGDRDITLEEKFGIEILEDGEERIGYLYNVKETIAPPKTAAVNVDDNDDMSSDVVDISALLLYFIQKDGNTFRATFRYKPYFLVDINPQLANYDYMMDILGRRFEHQKVAVTTVLRHNLAAVDHLAPNRMYKLIKCEFPNTELMNDARRSLERILKANKLRVSHLDHLDDNDPFKDGSISAATGADPMDSIIGLFEYDLIHTVRTCIDNHIRCGKWYKVSSTVMGSVSLKVEEELLMKPPLRIFAWDIETSKAPLKFPDAQQDEIMMVSVMVDGDGYLIVNRQQVHGHIEDFEYSPKPEFEGFFECINCDTEKELLIAFFDLLLRTRPHITVTFNGDFFDLPYVHDRAQINSLNLYQQCGISRPRNAIKGSDSDFWSGKFMTHMDCFCWVKRDSYLPQGSQGLKAVTRAKLKYDPVELDPELMVPFAREKPQELASYSVSDALATYHLYCKYIHDFVFALASIIPMNPDDVLRRGSGTLCEALLMAQATEAGVLYPNKHQQARLAYHDGRLIETSTYEGGRVECLRTGIFRSDIKEKFRLDVNAIDELIESAEKTCRFFVEKEEKLTVDDVENFEEVVNDVVRALQGLRDDPNRSEEPLIYHLDVAAMYPNIILSNRLQPSAVVTPDFCNQCSYSDPQLKSDCKRNMEWKWRGDLYMATRADVQHQQNELSGPRHKYTATVVEADGSSTVRKVGWDELTEREQMDILIKNVRNFSLKAYKRVKSSVFEVKTDTVCQRENPFYIDTVRAFRDRRYTYKGLVKTWGKKLGEAEASHDAIKVVEAKDMILLFDSLQLAHKCILNSFYGYVMRKGARWHSMTMAGIVTYTGSGLIREARAFVDRLGLPLELDTDGIWCMLPKSFPENFQLKLKSGKVISMPYPCSVLNVRVHEKYTNHQYQDLEADGTYAKSSQNSIFFEIDGPYKCMAPFISYVFGRSSDPTSVSDASACQLLPASTEEDRLLKKRYAVFNEDGSLAELKGFEIKRRGELKLIQVFQEELFPKCLEGNNIEEAYSRVGEVANRWLEVLDTKGASLTDEEVIHLISEKKTMSKSVEDSGTLKSTSITTATRMAEFLGSSILREKGISCHLIIARKPLGATPTERAIPVNIFSAEEKVKTTYLRKWMGDPSIRNFDIREIIDWQYYRTRLGAAIQKIISIPAMNQHVKNPCPSVELPQWAKKRVREREDTFKQKKITDMFARMASKPAAKSSRKKVAIQAAASSSSSSSSSSSVNALPDSATAMDIEEVIAPPPAAAAAEEDFPAEPSSPIVDVEDLPLEGAAALLRPARDEPVNWKKKQAQNLRERQHGTRQHKEALKERMAKAQQRLGAMAGQAQDDDGANHSSNPPTGPTPTSGVWSMTNRKLAVATWHILGCEPMTSAGSSTVMLWVKTADSPTVFLAALGDSKQIDELLDAIGLEKIETTSQLSGGLELPRHLLTESAFEVTLKPSVSAAWLGELCRAVPPSLRGVKLFECPDSGSLVFEVETRITNTVQFYDPTKVPDSFFSDLKLDSARNLRSCTDKYLPVQQPPPRHCYVYFMTAYDAAIDYTRIFAAAYLPTGMAYAEAVGEVRVYVCGTEREQEVSDTSIDRIFRESLLAAIGEDNVAALDRIAPAQVEYSETPTQLQGLMEQQISTWQRRHGAMIAVVTSNSDDPRHMSPPFIPIESAIMRTPLGPADADFPPIDWVRWNLRRWSRRLPRLQGWFKNDRLWLARLSGIPVCCFPANQNEAVAAAWDVMFAKGAKDQGLTLSTTRQEEVTRVDLAETSELLLEAKTGRPDLGDVAEINNPGIYRSVCLSIDLNSTVCITALVKAQQLSDLFGGELSRQRAVVTAGGALGGSAAQPPEYTETGLTDLIDVNAGVPAIADGGDISVASTKTFTCLLRAVEQLYSRGRAAEAKLIKLLNEPKTEADKLRRDQQIADGSHAAAVEALECELKQIQVLLDGVYPWVCDSTSCGRLSDRSIRDKVLQFMSYVLRLLVSELKRSAGSIELVYASCTKLIISTGRISVADVTRVWKSIQSVVMNHAVLEPLSPVFQDVSAIDMCAYGLLWMDPANWSALPTDPSTGSVNSEWEIDANWKMAEFLPNAMRAPFYVFCSEYLVNCMKAMVQLRNGKRLVTLEEKTRKKRRRAQEIQQREEEIAEATDAQAQARCELDDLMDDERARGDAVDEGEDEANPSGGAADVMTDQQIMAEVQAYACNTILPELRQKLYRYVSNVTQVMQNDEAAMAELRRRVSEGEESDYSSEDEESLNSDDEDFQLSRKERLEKRLQQCVMKWEFPMQAAAARAAANESRHVGRAKFSDDPVLEFVKCLTHVLGLDSSNAQIADLVHSIRNDLIQLLRKNVFSEEAQYSSPIPLIRAATLTDVLCYKCHRTSNIDVNTSPTKEPGIWECPSCQQSYDKDAIEGRLVESAHLVVYAWQTQQIICGKCRRAKHANLSKFCKCSGDWVCRISREEAVMALKSLHSVALVQQLPWLTETTDLYVHMLQAKEAGAPTTAPVRRAFVKSSAAPPPPGAGSTGLLFQC
ncbi:hypothetical protein FOL47_001752 [Perkinsus chesapeaki]|uniref:DNA-directed DNA polymerase n=1 Tax=Perkinsus chesapeaki TaxID=330153 RepID=A0A7J6MHI8_PERCH|nr:hypothetical protein FOL47_001752 [Perkinsus chesapeaki]